MLSNSLSPLLQLSIENFLVVPLDLLSQVSVRSNTQSRKITNLRVSDLKKVRVPKQGIPVIQPNNPWAWDRFVKQPQDRGVNVAIML